MQSLTSEGQQKIHEIASRYGISTNAVTTMLHAVLKGGGTMAQFNIPELGGSGQWMQGGMTMVGDMFNYSLQSTVSNLCHELSQLAFTKNLFVEPSHPKGAGPSAPGKGWWPVEFGVPTSTGSQNHMRYAYFASPVSRLVIETNGKQSVYDTLTHQISGVSQQQGSSHSLLFTSQHGTVDIQQLPLVTDLVEPTPATEPTPRVNADTPANASGEGDIMATIERLADLLKKGILTQEEFNAKKSELLKRL